MIFVHAGFGERGVDFARGWELQRRVHARRVADEIGDTVLLLEHPPVYTVGRGGDARTLAGVAAPVVAVDRAGGSTWHGPGQLVGYPVVRLAGDENAVAFNTLVAEALVRVCGEFGIRAFAARDGVRVAARDGTGAAARDDAGAGSGDRLLATIGTRVAQGVTLQGFALNCDPDPGWFEPLAGRAGSLSGELGRPVPVREALPAVERHLAERLGALETFHRTLAQLADAP